MLKWEKPSWNKHREISRVLLRVEVICRKTMELLFPPSPPSARLTQRHVSLASARKSGSGVANYVRNSPALFRRGWKPKLPLAVRPFTRGRFGMLRRTVGVSLINDSNTPPQPTPSSKAAQWQFPQTSSSPLPQRSPLPAGRQVRRRSSAHAATAGELRNISSFCNFSMFPRSITGQRHLKLLQCLCFPFGRPISKWKQHIKISEQHSSSDRFTKL